MKYIYSLLAIGLFSISFLQGQENEPKEDPNFSAYELDELMDQLEPSGRPWLPFLQGQNVLSGIYHLKAGTTDGQKPHGTDEVYYVASGKGKFTADEQTVSIQEGSILFVKAEVDHRFHDIEEDLVLVVFFDR